MSIPMFRQPLHWRLFFTCSKVSHHPVQTRYVHHRLGEIMDELKLGNRTLAAIMSPEDPKRRETLRVQIVGWRGGKGMELESAERCVDGLHEAGWDGTLDEFVTEYVTEIPATPASPESLDLLEERVGAVETQLGLLVAELRELRAFLQPPGAAPRSSPLPHRPNVEDQ